MKEEENTGMSPIVNLKIRERVKALVDKCKIIDEEAEEDTDEDRDREKRRLRYKPPKFKI